MNDARVRQCSERRAEAATLSAWSIIPRIEERHARGLEIGDVSGDDGHAVNKRGRRDQPVARRPRGGDMQSRAAARHNRIDG